MAIVWGSPNVYPISPLVGEMSGRTEGGAPCYAANRRTLPLPASGRSVPSTSLIPVFVTGMREER
ncbi:hypothetical protein AMC87_CH01065 [Rhizobium phaseoli]|nr:hypothetical protein AMC87_CH01065 [Rhizobium phaseoli]